MVQTANTQQVTTETIRVSAATTMSSMDATPLFQEYVSVLNEPSHAVEPSVAPTSQAFSYTPSTQTLSCAQRYPPVTSSPWQPKTSFPRPPPPTSVTWYYHPLS